LGKKSGRKNNLMPGLGKTQTGGTERKGTRKPGGERRLVVGIGKKGGKKRGRGGTRSGTKKKLKKREDEEGGVASKLSKEKPETFHRETVRRGKGGPEKKRNEKKTSKGGKGAKRSPPERPITNSSKSPWKCKPEGKKGDDQLMGPLYRGPGSGIKRGDLRQRRISGRGGVRG